MGRTLPNMFALFPGAWAPTLPTTLLTSVSLVNLAVSLLIPNSTARGFSTQSRLLAAISLLVFTAVVFRSEVALLLAPVALHAMLFVVPPFRVIKTGILSAAVSIGKEGSRLEKLDAT